MKKIKYIKHFQINESKNMNIKAQTDFNFVFTIFPLIENKVRQFQKEVYDE